MSKFLRESQNGFDRIDTKAGIIYGVKVLGAKSKNGRIYEDAAMRRAVPMYEGVSVNLNHIRNDPNTKSYTERPIQDRWGVLKNARFEDGSIYADLHYLKSHPATPQLVEAAARFPETFGLSHDAGGDEQMIDGERRVVELYEVRSVDVVADPATNAGLFESYLPSERQQMMESRLKRRSVRLARMNLLEVRDGDGDGKINDGKSSEGPAPQKKASSKLSQADRIARAERRSTRYARMANKAYSRGQGYIDASNQVGGPMSDRLRARGDELVKSSRRLMGKSSTVKKAIAKVSEPSKGPSSSKKIPSSLTQADKVTRAQRRADRYQKKGMRMEDKGNTMVQSAGSNDKQASKGYELIRAGNRLTGKSQTVRKAIDKVKSNAQK
jgi:hypothetical protein